MAGIYRANSDLVSESRTEKSESDEFDEFTVQVYPRFQTNGSITFDAALMLAHCTIIHVVGHETRADAKKELGERMRKMQAVLMRLRVGLE